MYILIALLIFYAGVAAGLFVAALLNATKEFNERPEVGI